MRGQSWDYCRLCFIIGLSGDASFSKITKKESKDHRNALIGETAGAAKRSNQSKSCTNCDEPIPRPASPWLTGRHTTHNTLPSSTVLRKKDCFCVIWFYLLINLHVHVSFLHIRPVACLRSEVKFAQKYDRPNSAIFEKWIVGFCYSFFFNHERSGAMCVCVCGGKKLQQISDLHTDSRTAELSKMQWRTALRGRMERPPVKWWPCLWPMPVS